MATPSYRAAYGSGLLQERAERARSLLRRCLLCPRNCAVDRRSGPSGCCRTGTKARVAACQAHFGEETVLVGRHGSGTIFMSCCNLLCTFCQNYDISHGGEGGEVDAGQLAAMMLALQGRGCRNINLVTPTHVVPQILEALVCAAEKGLRIPLVYNSAGYEKVETLRLLDGIVDIYMPDFKFWEGTWAERFCRAPDYPVRAREALREMHRQVGDLQVDASGTACRGLLVRHLVMPGGVAGSREIMEFLAREISKNTFVNIMDQYRPCGESRRDALIGRPLHEDEYRSAVRAAREAGLTRIDGG
ncbi:MAG: hypothetical protein A4E73_01093 [Syntrophaceae bacterium PtaU1.Bin231]|nr:MAG: hypothetical protein A4E73_01093 [Syntrophaceae bacterium PtaU1.Bin231]